MPNNSLQLVYNQVQDLIPHIEERALKYVMRQYAMPSRVTVLGDMTGFNERKISEYLPPSRASNATEFTDLTTNNLLRARKASISPIEIGTRYPISDRRISTDLEDIAADSIEAIGKSLGDRVEADLMRTALNSFRFTFGNSAAAFTEQTFIDAAMLFQQRGARGRTLYCVIHPYQALQVMKELVDYANNPANLQYRNEAIRAFRVPTFNLLELVIGDFLPRKVVNTVAVYGTGGTFRLQVGAGYVIGENITAAITVSATPATMATNIQTALNALDMSSFYSGSGTWTVDGTGGLTDITITPPADLYLDAEQELRVAIQADENATIDSNMGLQKSAYDLVTGLSGAPTDMDGNEVGVTVREASASAKALLFYPNALILDVRQPVQSFSELVNQGRTIELSANMKYGAGKWSPEMGAFIESTANAPAVTY